MAFIERTFGPKAGQVHVTVSIRPVAAFDQIERELPAPQLVKGSLGNEEAMTLGSLPWRLKFHRFEEDKARFCVEPRGSE